MSRKKRERNAEKQRFAIDQRLRLLRNLQCITETGVTAKGEVAALVNGFELPVAELLESGLLEWLDEAQLAVVFASLVFEERKNDLYRRLPPNVLGPHRADVEQVVGRLVQAEKDLGLPSGIRPPNFKIGAVIHAWCRGAGFDELRDLTTTPNGDLVRVMRLTVQVLRQLRSALPPRSPLALQLDRARELLNRDEVDAARQLSLG